MPLSVSSFKTAEAVQQREDILLYMPFRMSAAAWLYVTGICLMPKLTHFECHPLAFLTGY